MILKSKNIIIVHIDNFNMKKSVKLLAVFCLLMAQTAVSQNINLKFKGATTDGKYVQLDSVWVENLNRGWSETLVYPDTIISFSNTGITELQNASGDGIIAYPNPFYGITSVFLTLLQSEVVTLQVYNLAGQRIMEKSVQVEAGESHFDISLDHPQVCFLVASTIHGRFVQKLINTSSSGDNNIAYIETKTFETLPTKTQKLLSAKEFHAGDVLRMTGYVTHNGNVVASNEILQPQTESESFTLFFSLQNINLPTITTIAASSITATTAISGGTITNDGGAAVVARGVCWSTSPNPTISDNYTFDGTGIGNYTSNITGLVAGTIYYVRAYATNAVGTAYGNEITFATNTMGPTIITAAISNITENSAVGGGNITSDGGVAIIARGVCWDTIPNPTINSSHTTNGGGMGSFTSNLIGLTAGTTYYVRAYAVNAVGTTYGNEVLFTTNASLPTLTTLVASSITDSSAVSGGSITNDGGNAVIARGVCWSTTPNPTISDNYTFDGIGIGNYTSNMTGLMAGITYYVRSYATNAIGTAYGNQVSFTTNATLPTLTTIMASNITDSSAAGGGNIASDGGAAIVARGVCWDTTPNPTISGNHTNNGSGTGSFTGNLTGLTAGTTYYVRAYATNAIGTAYGNQVSFTTNATFPTLTTIMASNITDSTAVSGGNLSSDGGTAIVARGVCWDTTPNPTINGNHTNNGSGIGSFTSNLTGLTAGTTYYVRAYATNAVGTEYGNQIMFTTTAVYTSVITSVVSNITDSSAAGGGNVTNNGGIAIIARGICWSTSPNPTINDNHTTNGTDTGAFTSNITGLIYGTTYYVRAYVTNSAGTTYGNEVSFHTITKDNYALFSVSASDVVLFSPGNLQWSAKNGGSTATTHIVAGNDTAAGTWRFAPHQWDDIAANNSSISSTYSGWIDLFGWGTSGYNNEYPYMTSTANTDYGNGNNDISDTYYDWGVYNAIYNPRTNTTDAPGTWHTLTSAEWNYLLNTRTTPSGIRYAKGIVMGENGLIIVPDNWSTSGYLLTNINTANAAYTSNTINVTDWAKMEALGCVFLPTAGYRSGTTISGTAAYGHYWSSTYYNNNNANYIYFTSSAFSSTNSNRYYGRSVRLVRSLGINVTTTAVSNITDTSAVCGGHITSDGGFSIIARGVCWDTTPNPTINGNHTIDGSDTGSFTSNITGLTTGTIYYVRAYATSAAGIEYGNQIMFTTVEPINSFSVAAGSYVYFAPGNLQWSATNGGNIATTHRVADSTTAAGTWRFAPNQWDTIGWGNIKISSTYKGWIDLFGWGTSGYNNKYPYMTNTTASYYGNGNNDIIGTYYDWGVYNEIYNPQTNTTDAPGMWRTLTKDEWVYLLNTRTTSSGIRYAKAQVNGVNGLIIVPDNWDTTIYVLSGTNKTNYGYNSNNISAIDWWSKMEAAGCVFLPAAGGRGGTSVIGVGSGGNYWSTTCDGSSYAYDLYFNSSTLNPSYNNSRSGGLSVRLVRSADIPTKGLPIVVTTAVNDITDTSVVCGGNVISDRGATIIACGICWDTLPNPTINSNHTIDGVDTGSFISNITGLTAGTTYFVRAYATNAVGTAYGKEMAFITTGMSKNQFSVSNNQKVLFSPGNLQWSATNGDNVASIHDVAGDSTAAGTWRFAPNQWDIIGANNKYISSTYNGWIDLFGWGTSGYNQKYPYMTSTTSTSYGNGNNHITGTYYDWGVYNAIYNPKTNTIDVSDIWRTLTINEWNYLLNTRNTSSGVRYAKAQVNGVNGLIIVPDNWMTSIYHLDSVNSKTVNYTYNAIDSSDWSYMEAAGCVFLPAAGYRSGTTISGVGSNGYYWLATHYGSNSAYRLYFYSSSLSSSGYYDLYYGASVRLVRYTQAVVPTILTDTVCNITDTSAVCGGHIFSTGGDSIIARGICWDTLPNPTINGNHTIDSSGIGKFISNITGLTHTITYYVRAYATNAAGTAYGNEIMFTTMGPSKSFSVSAKSYIFFSPGNLQWSATNGGDTATTHVVAGNNTAEGTWRFAPNQLYTIGIGNSNIDSSYTGWIDLFGWGTSGVGNRYPYMTSTNSADYGNTPTDIAITNYDWGEYNAIYNPKTQTTDVSGTWRTLTQGEWNYLLNTRNTSSGVRYAKATVNGSAGLIIVPDNWNTAIYALSGTNTTSSGYNSNNISAANWVQMEDAGCIFLPAAGGRNGTSVNGIGSGGSYWSATCHNSDGAYFLNFSSGGLNSSNYTYRYDGLSVRLVRSADAVVPTLTTDTISNITDTSAVCGGIITNNGGVPLSVWGVCWDTLPNPTINGNHTTDGSNTYRFTSTITGLTPTTTYYVRAYATNVVGTAYGNQVSFTTNVGIPVIAKTIVDSITITDTSAVCGGIITHNGGVPITARGVCWDTLPHPTINGNHTIGGSDTGTFMHNIIGLTPFTAYYVRAYTTNSVGTAYGNEVVFYTIVQDTLFSVSDTQKVQFSPGNLQWSATNGGNTATTHVVAGNGTVAGTWRFAPNQWDTIGRNNRNISSTYTGWIDLFGWGTSGYNNKYPYMTSASNYGNGNNNISGTYYDWGEFNAIYNPSTDTTDAPGIWRTLTKGEWNYLLNTRNTSSGVRYAKATVNGIAGLIIVPDNWSNTYYPLTNVNTSGAASTSNIIGATDWAKMEYAGCVFLPATGERTGTSVFYVGSVGRYWSTTYYDSDHAYILGFSSNYLNAQQGHSRSEGASVRLVKDVW